ncbi:PilZ domain-containing protein [Gallaecimonas xiamenensis]|uniref:Type IV pilus assembly PilZ n=1 Tax=Gallaecimonas xiamenensis 3-C-1 TaxID=745411 RepID=K2JB84_9GAMM|nr:PilZ domain-containing protein [Gallaecimonas xiamenensis]EKE72398.1 type IV pilus assembly PilZ [Gallaecimonas xiamenensis 3-C-1]
MVERSRFIQFVGNTPVRLCKGERCWDFSLLDLSLQGAVIGGALPSELLIGDHATLSLRLPEGDAFILMHTQIRFLQEGRLGVECLSICPDSSGHLKRMAALYLGSTNWLYRDCFTLWEDQW